MNKRNLSYLIFVGLAILSPVTALAQPDIRDQLRGSLTDSLKLPAGEQIVTFGPLSDGRILNFSISFHSDGGNPYIKKVIGENRFSVGIPRQKLSYAPFIEDAMMGCFLRPETCAKMEDYMDVLTSTDEPGRMRFFDEVYPEYTSDFTTLRSKDFWLPAIQRGIESSISIVDLHEICHAVLEHLGSRFSIGAMNREGEADGCMTYMLEIGGVSPVGGLVYQADALYRVEVLGDDRTTHPSPTCRVITLTEATLKWLEYNYQSIIDRSRAEDAIEFSALQEQARKYRQENFESCAAYDEAFDGGHKLAAKLIADETILTSSP